MMFSIRAAFSGYASTVDKGAALRFRTEGEVTPEISSVLHSALHQSGVLVFATDALSSEELAAISDKTRPLKTGKSKSQLLRDVLVRAWEKGVRVEPGESLTHYYDRRMLTFKAIVLEEIQEAEG